MRQLYRRDSKIFEYDTSISYYPLSYLSERGRLSTNPRGLGGITSILTLERRNARRTSTPYEELI